MGDGGLWKRVCVDRQLYSAGLRERALSSVVSRDLGMLARLKLERILGDERTDGHNGCVNTVAFTPEGDYLLSGSDDLNVIMWRWRTGQPALTFEPLHTNNIFQARALPHTENRTIITCAADGQVRVTWLNEAGKVASSRRLARHGGRAHKISLCPDAPQCFLSSGEDGRVLLFDLRAPGPARGSENGTASTSGDRGDAYVPMQKMTVYEHGSCNTALEVDAVHHNPARPWLFSAGGGDCLARVYDTRLWRNSASMVAGLMPSHMRGALARGHSPHITCVQYSRTGELLATYHEESIYRFSAAGASGQQASSQPRLLGPAGGGGSDEEEAGEEVVGGARAAAGQQGSQAQAAEAGRGPGGAQRPDRKRKASGDASRELGSSGGGGGGSGSGGGTGGSGGPGQVAPEAQQDGAGQGPGAATRVPHADQDHVLQRYTGHRNVQTVKGVSFFGMEDEYVVSGSDCGHVFIWTAEGGQLLRVLKGDQWVVNCLEPHPYHPLLLCTSGIEKVIKVWSPLASATDVDVPQLRKEVQRVVQANEERERRNARRGLQMDGAQLLRLFEQRSERQERARQQTSAAEQEEEEGEALSRLQAQLLRAAASNPDGPASALLRLLFSTRDEDSEQEEEEDSDEHPAWAHEASSTSEEQETSGLGSRSSSGRS